MISRIGRTFAFISALLCSFLIPGASDALTLSLETPSFGTESAESSPESVPHKSAAEPVKENTVKVGRVGLVSASEAGIFCQKSSNSKKLATVKAETPLAIIKEEGQWYGVLMSNGRIGWIKSIFVTETDYDLIAKKPFDRRAKTSRGGKVSRDDVWRMDLVGNALQARVARYVYGGTNPSTGMDCSAFVRMVFGYYNIKLPRTAREQAHVGQSVPFDELQPGDRLYFSCRKSYIDHCGIYVGDGMFVHCSASRNGVGVDSLASDFYWKSLVAAKRS